MGRLKALAPRLRGLAPRLATLPPGDRQAFDRARDAQPWRRWYKTARWQRLRMDVLVRDLFTCQWPGCGRVVGDASQLVADHRVPHRGDAALFWDAANLQCLCKHCHDGPKARAEARAG